MLSVLLCSTMALAGCRDGPSEVPQDSDVLSASIAEKEMNTEYIFPVVRNLCSKDDENNSEELKYVEVDKWGNLYPYSYYLYSEENKATYLSLYNAIHDYDKEVKLTETVTTDQVFQIYKDMLTDNPDYFYVSPELTVFTKSDTDLSVNKVQLNYLYDKTTATKMQQELKVISETVSSKLPADISRYDLYLYLHDFIIMNAVYDETYVSPNNADAYGCLVNKQSTCTGFAKAFVYLCKEQGVVTATATGLVGASHMWNVVPYNDGWFCIDVGMDNVDSQVASDWANHNFFGVSDTFLTEIGNHQYFTPEDDAYIESPTAELRGYSLFDIQPECYQLTSDNAVANVEKAIIEAYNTDRNYVEFQIDSSSEYDTIKSTVLNPNGNILYSILENAARTGQLSISTTNVAITFEDWNKSIILYYFVNEGAK